MNTERGEFVPQEEAEPHMQTLDIGEVVKVKDEEFQVVAIKGRLVALRLMSAQDRSEADPVGLAEFLNVDRTPPNRVERRRAEALQRKAKKRDEKRKGKG